MAEMPIIYAHTEPYLGLVEHAHRHVTLPQNKLHELKAIASLVKV